MRLPRIRSRGVPEAVGALPVDGRRLAWAVARDGTPLAATPAALHVGDERLPWTSIAKATWRPSTLTIEEVADVDGDGRTRSWELAEDARLARTVRDRVTASVAFSERRALRPSGHVRIAARRDPDGSPLVWQVVWDSAADAADADRRAQVDAMLESLRSTLG